jgi:hypothetical protein
VYNIQKAVSRLDFAPKLKEIEITDITKGIGVFTPKPERAVSFAALQTALKKAGYTLDTAAITIAGTLARDGDAWQFIADRSGQRFILQGPTLAKELAAIAPGARIEITGDWQTDGTGATAHEVVTPRSVKTAEQKRATTLPTVTTHNALRDDDNARVSFMPVRFVPAPARIPAHINDEAAMLVAPIRTTSPGLTVYKGGALIPRLSFVRQHLGALVVHRQLLDLSVTYTPTSKLQLEAEVPVSHTDFDDGAATGASAGLGNITLWGKYRFYRRVETYGDRQAAARFGLELPTGRHTAPRAQQLHASAFVRQQLTPTSGGFAPTAEVTYSQALKRFIFGGNMTGVLRTERAGFRMGHELRLNTDTELVVFPFKYRRPVKELFAILETTFVRRGVGRVDGQTVPGSTSTEYYLAPGLQYVATPRLVVEASFQVPVVQHTGPEVLRTDRNVLFALHYLF